MWNLAIPRSSRVEIAQAIVAALPQADAEEAVALAALSRALPAPGTVDIDEVDLFTVLGVLKGKANIALRGAYHDAHAEYWEEADHE
jgi:hypothetical protein